MLSVVILTKNEEKNIIDCLETVLWADEIIIIDDYSTDRTLEVVKQLDNPKIRIYVKALEGDFSKQRNYGLSKATKTWVLFIDADERINNDLHEEINSIIINSTSSDKFDGYFIKRKDFMWGKILKHGELSNIKLLRLAKKRSGEWIGKVHEVWKVSDQINELDSVLLHYPHPTMNEFLAEINFYTMIRAKELYENQIKVKAHDIIFYPLGKFILNYFFKLGILDGVEGLIFAIMMSFHSFLVRSKLWLLWKKN